MNVIYIDDPTSGQEFHFYGSDEHFMDELLNCCLVDFWLENAEDDEGEKVFGADYEWTSPEQLVKDITDWACEEAIINHWRE